MRNRVVLGSFSTVGRKLHERSFDSEVSAIEGKNLDGPACRSLNSPWLTEPEAAEYCRCLDWAFRNMRFPAKNSGGRKVYPRDTLDASIQARPWDCSVVSDLATSNATLAERLSGKRQRPYKPRKKAQDR